MGPRDSVADLVARCLELHDEGSTEIPFGEVCADQPELLAEVVANTKFALGLPALQVEGAGRDAIIGSLMGGRYKVDGRLGSGAMGVVYSAADLDLSRDVAIKVMHAGLLNRDESIERFEREAAALAAVDHEGIATIFDRGVTDDGSPFLVMEKIEGVSLADILDRVNRRDVRVDDGTWLGQDFGIEGLAETSYLRQAVTWAAALAEALGAAHDRGIFHRDVKPSNVMIRHDGRVVLLDFGIAGAEDLATLTRSDAAVGTPAYMAPEALSGRRKLHATQDVYGLSATLYHLLTFKAPYEGSPPQVLAALATREPVPAVRLRPGLPLDAQAILDNGLERNPSKRYQSAKVIEKDLRAFLAYQPVSVRPTTTLTRAMRRIRRSRAALGAAAALLLVGALALGRAVHSSVLASRAEAFVPVYQKVPANTGIVKRANRRIADAKLRLEVEQTFDQLVKTGHDVVTARTLRGLFRWDHGNLDGAANDMRAIALEMGTALASALAEQYENAAARADGNNPVDLTSLPTPRTALDGYLVAIHSIRAGKIDVAERLLSDVELNEVRHAVELRFVLSAIPMSQYFNRKMHAEVHRESDALIAALTQFEERTGYQSATTLHLRGLAYTRVHEYEKALVASVAGAAMAPASHVILQNAGHAAFQLSRYADAESLLTKAMSICSEYVSLQKTLAMVLAESGSPERALEVAHSAEFSDSDRGRDQQSLLLGRVSILCALQQRPESPEKSRAYAAQATAALSRLPDDMAIASELRRYAAALQLETDGDGELFTSVLVEVVDEPFSRERVNELVSYFPTVLNPEQQELVKRWMTNMRDHYKLLATGRNTEPSEPQPSKEGR